MSKCVICGNELLTGDIHWEQGMCNQCYNINRYPDPYFELKTDKRLLRRREEYIQSLEQQLAIYKRALELACDSIRDMYCSDYCVSTRDERCKEKCCYEKYYNEKLFLDQIEKEIKSI